MKDPLSKGIGPRRAPARPRRAGRAWALALATLGLCVAAPAHDTYASSAGVRMRRARFALARGAEDSAITDLEAVRRAAPGSAQGLEAALLLADLHFSVDRPGRAESILAAAHAAAPGATRAPISLARGWLAVSRGASGEARAQFTEGRAAPSSLARAAAEIGLVWAALASALPAPNLAPLETIARADGPAGLRFAAGWTLARAHAASGDHRRAVRELRRLRRDFRATSLEDDLELSLGLAQLDAGRIGVARRTFRRLERRFGSSVARDALDRGLRLADLRAPNADFVARVSALYARRETRSIGLLPFLGALFDREAARDARAATALAERALAARKEGER